MKSAEESAPSRRGAAPRVRRWLVRVAVIAAGAVAALALAAAIGVHELDAPWLKGRIVAAVRAASGVELDYGSVRIRPASGLVVEGLVVRTPPALRDVEPVLARVGRIDVSWSPGALLGRAHRVERVTLDDVAVTLVTDEHGHGSLDLPPGRAGPAPRPAPSPTPPSRRAAELLASAPPVGRVELTSLTVTVVRAAGGRVADRFTIRGLSLTAETEPAGGAFRLRVAAGAPSAPLVVDITRDGAEARPAAARLEATLAAEASPAGADASLDVRVRAQTFAPGVAPGELLHAVAKARFDPARRRTEVSLSDVRAADGAAAAEAELVLDDTPGALPLVRTARGHVDVARLLRLVPAGLVPATLARGEARWHAEGIVLGPPFIVGDGALAADATLEDLRVSVPGGALALGSARFGARVTAGPKGHATLRAERLHVASGPRRIELEAIDARLEGARAGDGTWVVDLSGGLPSLAAQAPAGRVAAEGVRWDVRIPLSGGRAYAARADVPVQRLRLIAADGRPIVDAPAHVELRASDVVPDRDRPAASRGVAELSLSVGPARASLRAAKERDAVDVELRASAPELASLRPSQGAAAAWERMRIDVTTQARVERLASPAPHVEQHTTARVAGLAWAGVSAEEATLDVRSSGDAVEHRAELDARLRAIRGAGLPTADQHLAVSAHVDRRRPAAELRLTADGAATGTLTGAVALDPRRGAVRLDVDGRLDRVAALARLGLALAGRPDRPGAAPPLDLDRLALAVHGEVPGVVSAGPDGAPRLAAAALRTAAPAGTVELRADGLVWRSRGRVVTVPSGSWRATFGGDGARRTVESVAELAELHVDTGEHRLDAVGLVHRAAATLTGEPATGELDLEQRLEVGSLRQDLAAYPVEGARATARLRRDRDGAVQLSELRVDNAAAGTALDARGVLETSGFRRRLSLQGRLEQDLARLASATGTFTGGGRVTVDVSVESPDLAVFRTASAVRFAGVDVRVPARGFAVEGLDGEVPVSADVALRAGRTVLLRQSGVNPYPAVRFADQHPLLTGASFVTARRLDTPLFSAAPLAGNVEVQQNLVSVSQLEMGVRTGTVTGACVLDLNGRRTTLEARVRATGVLSSRGEPFDGHAAVVVSAADRSVEGRAEILRIGRRHLLDLLDVQDPRHGDAAANRVRHALALGYPDRVRVTFDHGFASARVTFGGLAALVRLDEVRGIPMGPLVDRALAPLSRSEALP